MKEAMRKGPRGMFEPARQPSTRRKAYRCWPGEPAGQREDARAEVKRRMSPFRNSSRNAMFSVLEQSARRRVQHLGGTSPSAMQLLYRNND